MLKLHNTLTKRKEAFEPIEKGKAKIYTCGPTVYNYAGIHNFSAYIVWDLLVRTLKLFNHETNWVSNITDVGHLTDDDIADSTGEDKLAKAARKEGKTMRQIANFYTDIFLTDWKKLRLTEPNERPLASKYAPKMIEAIKELEKMGIAYDAPDAVYFHVPAFPEYGKLSGNKELDKLEGGGRAQTEGKKDPRDFALWRKNIGERDNRAMSWDSPWGPGVPGWHIECSVMAAELLGETIDIHAGGEDNIFPHHECEIAQSESLTGKTFSNYWIHRKHFLVDGSRMAKSAGNFYRLDDIIEKGFSPIDFRMLVLTSHYRDNLNFTWDLLTEAKRVRQKLADAYHKLPADLENKPGPLTERFKNSLADDLNVSEALAVAHEAARRANKNQANGDVKAVFDFFIKTFDVFDAPEKTQPIPSEVQELLDQRQKARDEKNFTASDQLREKIEKLGFSVEDTSEGQKVKKK